ncbi:MAG TPA: DUF2079 domain-containing protein [Vicinamibacterales bacterium]|nr:DUF2079 domain-containing protein [Vicinamibacterales bacterium]
MTPGQTPQKAPPLTRAQIWTISALAATCAASYALTAVFRHQHFDSSVDLGIFDQAVWHLSRFEAPSSSIRGFSNLFGDHFHPIILLFAPLYWLAPAAETLLVAQAVLFGASIVPVFLFMRTRLPWGTSVALSAAYGLFWGLQRAANFDVHEVAFAPLAIAMAILAMDRRRWTLFWISCVAVGLVKEDLIPFLTGLGVYLTISGEPRRGAVLTAASLVAFWAVLRVVIPAFGEGLSYNYLSSYGDVMRRPWTIPIQLVVPTVKLQTIVLWLAPFAFLSLRSPLALLVVPLALERFLSESPNFWGASFHYTAPLAPILAMSAGDGLARLARQTANPLTRTRLMRGAVTASLLLSSLLPGRQPHWRLLTSKHYRAAPFEAEGNRVLALIPANASVAAQTALLPHLSQRNHIYVLDPGAPDTDFIVSTSHVSPWPVASLDQLSELVAARRRRGYTVQVDRDGWQLLRRDESNP